MANITGIERKHIEIIFQMSSGYVLDFYDRTFREFFQEQGIEIDDKKYHLNGPSKANRLRTFFQLEDDNTVGRVIKSLLEYTEDMYARDYTSPTDRNSQSLEKVKELTERLLSMSPIQDIYAIAPTSSEDEVMHAFNTIHDSIERDAPQSGLDHLHTLLVHFVRKVCDKHLLQFSSDESLNSIFGKYVRWLQENNRLQSQMSHLIMKSSISLLEKFNGVRNDQSLAHANPLLNKNEASLIFNNITSLVRFIRFIENI